jgi:hypothetical protein
MGTALDEKWNEVAHLRAGEVLVDLFDNQGDGLSGNLRMAARESLNDKSDLRNLVVLHGSVLASWCRDRLAPTADMS